jgi:hypothetical protein
MIAARDDVFEFISYPLGLVPAPPKKKGTRNISAASNNVKKRLAIAFYCVSIDLERRFEREAHRQFAGSRVSGGNVGCG